MDKIFLDENNMDRFDHIHPRENGESELYVGNGILYKILHEDYRTERENLIPKLDKDDVIHFVKILKMIYSNASNQFLGITENYIDGSLTLADYALNSPYDYNARVNLCHQIIETYIDMLRKNYFFRDLHDGNVIIKDDKLTFVDIDGVIKDPKNTDYACTHEIYMSIDTFQLLYNLLLNKNLWQDYISVTCNKRFAEALLKEIKKEFKKDPIMTYYFSTSVFELIYSGISMEDFVDNITEDKVMTLERIYKRNQEKYLMPH